MRIVFVCGSLEPGRDGVGDYTRRLAAALISQGHFSAAIALHDNHLKTAFDGLQDVYGVSLPVLRIPAGQSKASVLNLAEKWIEHFNPDWCSLQYVPFAFHPKGLAFRLSDLLLKLAPEKRWHIMVHELWVGMDKKAQKKQVLWGLLQRRLIQSLFMALQPVVIHTQSLLYQAQLARLGIQTDYLPLFSNIPLVNHAAHRSLNGQKKAPSISMVLFGTILAGAPAEDFANETAAYAKKKGVQVSLTMVGRTGEGQHRWAKAWQSAGLKLVLMGEQKAEQVSSILTHATIGISTTAVALADKSGAVAAMREHGIPVLCVSAVWQPRGISNLKLPAGIMEYRKGNLETCLETKIDSPEINTVVTVSQAFAKKLLAAQK